MIRVKTFDSTGIATAGRLYAGDLNLMQDGAAAQSDFTQIIDVASLRIGDTGIQLSKFGTSEAQFSGHLRTLGILRGLSGIISGAYTTVQRDAIAVGGAPYGMFILNTTTNQYEWNRGTDASRDWRTFGVDTLLSLTFGGAASAIHFTNQTALNTILDSIRAGDTVTRFMLREDGRHEFGPGNAARDAFLYRDAASRIRLDNELNLGGYQIYFGNLGASLMIDGVASRIRGGTMSFQNADGSQEYGFVGNDFYRFKDGRFALRGTPTKLFVQTGTFAHGAYGAQTVTFPVAFTAAPVVATSPVGDGGGGTGQVDIVTTTNFTFFSAQAPVTYSYIAIGPI